MSCHVCKSSYFPITININKDNYIELCGRCQEHWYNLGYIDVTYFQYKFTVKGLSKLLEQYTEEQNKIEGQKKIIVEEIKRQHGL